MSLIVHINGWPGCGKLTIARALAPRLDARLVDNHTLLNPAEALFERSDPKWQELRAAVRNLVLDHASRLDPKMPLVLTDALADDPYDSRLFEDWRALAARRGARLVAVVLACDAAENVRRLSAPGRSDLHKLTRPEVLLDLRSNYRLLRPSGVRLVDLDVTSLDANDAATMLAERIAG